MLPALTVPFGSTGGTRRLQTLHHPFAAHADVYLDKGNLPWASLGQDPGKSEATEGGHPKSLSTYSCAEISQYLPSKALGLPQVDSTVHFPVCCLMAETLSPVTCMGVAGPSSRPPFLEVFRCLMVQEVTTWQKCVPTVLQWVLLEVSKPL